MSLIAVITNNETDVFQREVIAGVARFATPKGHTLRIQHSADRLDDVAGVLVIANVLSDEMLATLYHSGKPISLVSHQVPDLPIPAVMPDNIGGMNQLVDYLILACGKRKLLFIQGDMNQNDGKERSMAFKRQLMRHDIDADSVPFLRGDFIPAIAGDSLREVIAAGIPFDAVAAADYLMAVTAWQILAETGQHGVCVVGFGDGPEAAEHGITTVGVDVEQIGYRAARQLIGQLDGLHIRGVTLLSTGIVERESCLRDG